MDFKRLLAAVGAAAVLILGAVGAQHSVEQGPVTVASSGDADDDTPWT